MIRLRAVLTRSAQWIANHLQPRIAREVQALRPEIHDARQRVHYLVVLTELAKLRKFPQEQGQR